MTWRQAGETLRLPGLMCALLCGLEPSTSTSQDTSSFARTLFLSDPELLVPAEKLGHTLHGVRGTMLPVRTWQCSIHPYPSMALGSLCCLRHWPLSSRHAPSPSKDLGECCTAAVHNQDKLIVQLPSMVLEGAMMLELLPSKTETCSIHQYIISMVTWDDVWLGVCQSKMGHSIFPAPPPAQSWGC